MGYHAICDRLTGKVLHSVSCSDKNIQATIDLLPDTHMLIAHFGDIDGDVYYFDVIDDVFKIKGNMGVMPDATDINTGDTFSLSGLPVPCTVEIEGNVLVTDDGECSFPINLAGTYTVVAKHPAYFDKMWEVTVV